MDIDDWPRLEQSNKFYQDVKELQIILEDMGYSLGTIDGLYGSKTEAAVKQFQENHKIQTTGIVGPTTRSILKDVFYHSPNPTPNSTPAKIKEKTGEPKSVPGTNKNSNNTPGSTGKLGGIKFTFAEQYGKRDVIYYNGSYTERRTGGTWTWRNNNPGNMRYYPFAKNHGAIGKARGFAVFPDYETEAKAQVSLLKSPGFYNSTISDIIGRYAPKDENDTEGYIRFITKRIKVDRDTKVSAMNSEQFDAFIKAIRIMEGYRIGKVY